MHKAETAYTIIGDEIREHKKRPTITNLALENVTVLEYDHTGACTHASLEGRSLSPHPKASDATCTILT